MSNDSVNRDDAVYNNDAGSTLPVYSKLADNTWEWVQDEYHSSYNNVPTDGSGWCGGRCRVNASDSNYN